MNNIAWLTVNENYNLTYLHLGQVVCLFFSRVSELFSKNISLFLWPFPIGWLMVWWWQCTLMFSIQIFSLLLALFFYKIQHMINSATVSEPHRLWVKSILGHLLSAQSASHNQALISCSWVMRKANLQCSRDRSAWTWIPHTGLLCDLFNREVCLGLCYLFRSFDYCELCDHCAHPHVSERRGGGGRKLKAQRFKCWPFAPSEQIFIYAVLSSPKLGE